MIEISVSQTNVYPYISTFIVKGLGAQAKGVTIPQLSPTTFTPILVTYT